MISVDEARFLILSKAAPLPAESISLELAAGRIQARDYLAPHPHPFFDQSAMDGYALRHEDLAPGDPLRVIGEIKAGDAPEPPVRAGEAVRIFTGAPVPEGADTVVMQEMTTRDGDRVGVEGEVKAGANVRLKGEQLAKGGIAVGAGEILNAARIGLLATYGESVTDCIQKPVVAILSTGSEFAENDSELAAGKIYESNGVMLRAALRQMGIESTQSRVPDDPEAMRAAMEAASATANVLLTTGGVSVGAYDHTRPCLEACGYAVIFHKVNQKPGKPLLFAQKEAHRVAFGLPGNPRSALMSFYHYVYPYLRRSQGATALDLAQIELPLAGDYRKRDGKTHFVTGQIESGRVRILRHQNSHMLASFGAADLIVEIPAESDQLEAGSKVKAWVLPS